MSIPFVNTRKDDGSIDEEHVRDGDDADIQALMATFPHPPIDIIARLLLCDSLNEISWLLRCESLDELFLASSLDMERARAALVAPNTSEADAAGPLCANVMMKGIAMLP